MVVVKSVFGFFILYVCIWFIKFDFCLFKRYWLELIDSKGIKVKLVNRRLLKNFERNLSFIRLLLLFI